MGIFSSKKGLGKRSNDDSSAGEKKARVKKKKSFGLRKFFSFMFAAPEAKQRKYVDVYNRPTFTKTLQYEPGRGFSSVDPDYGTRIRCPVKETGVRRGKYTNYDPDVWTTEEMAQYDKKFKAVPIEDEVSDMMKISVGEITEDEMEIEEFGEFSEADIKYEEFEVPVAKPKFVEEIVKKEPVVEEVKVEAPIKEEIVEAPAVPEPETIEEEPIVEELDEEVVEIPVVDEVQVEDIELVEEPIQIEAPATAGLLMEARPETDLIVIEEIADAEIGETTIMFPEPVVEEVKIEEPVETDVLSFGFGSASDDDSETVMSFGFGFSDEEEGSAFVSKAVLTSKGTETSTVSM